MDCVKRPNLFLLISLMGIGFIIGGCVSVDTVRLTSQTFPPKHSIQEVEVLAENPKRAHIALAQLSVEDEAVSFGKEQAAILQKAADLGADAVVLHRGQQRTQKTLMYGGYGYRYGYPGWGYGSYGMGYGMGGYSMAGYGYAPYGMMGMPMTYDTTVRSLTGIAIRYKDG